MSPNSASYDLSSDRGRDRGWRREERRRETILKVINNEKSVHHYHSQPLNAAIKQINNHSPQSIQRQGIHTEHKHRHTVYYKSEAVTIGLFCFGLAEPL